MANSQRTPDGGRVAFYCGPEGVQRMEVQVYNAPVVVDLDEALAIFIVRELRRRVLDPLERET